MESLKMLMKEGVDRIIMSELTNKDDGRYPVRDGIEGERDVIGDD
jgi:hypothetical protein